jgi:hypothetical protein
MIVRLLAFCGLIACLVSAPMHDAAAADPRTALVIGNSHYSFAPIVNPFNDATDVAAALRGAGFDVVLKTDANQRDMSDSIRSFGDVLKRKGGVGLFFFAGHGVQANGENYIVPIGDAFADERDLKQRAVNAADLVDAMAAARNALNIVVLDACRDNPISHGTHGLSRIDSSASLFVSYSTSPGSVALDGAGRNSPYSKHLVQAIGVPDISLEDTFKRTLKGVYQETNGQQTPWISSSFFGDFFFTRGRGVPATGPQVALGPAAPSALTRPLSLTGVYRVEGRNPNGSGYRGMLTLNQDGDRFRLKWWIAGQAFNGTGQLAGKMLVVNWGDNTPVVYSYGGSDRLDGEWADGTAKETLNLFARATPDSMALAGGRYRVAGRNPDGSAYSGMVTMTSQSGSYYLQWRVGSSSYRGTGVLDGNLLTVDWGKPTPVIYALAADGSLKGLWDAGTGEETLVPDQ